MHRLKERKILILMLAFILSVSFALTGCGGNETDAPDDAETNGAAVTEGTLDLAVVPDGYELIPYEEFKVAFKDFTDRASAGETLSMADVEDIFGQSGQYYPDLDSEEYGIKQQTYAWFSDGDYGTGKVSIGIIFNYDESISAWKYYSYVSNGITIWDVEE